MQRQPLPSAAAVEASLVSLAEQGTFHPINNLLSDFFEPNATPLFTTCAAGQSNQTLLLQLGKHQYFVPKTDASLVPVAIFQLELGKTSGVLVLMIDVKDRNTLQLYSGRATYTFLTLCATHVHTERILSINAQFDSSSESIIIAIGASKLHILQYDNTQKNFKEIISPISGRESSDRVTSCVVIHEKNALRVLTAWNRRELVLYQVSREDGSVKIIGNQVLTGLAGDLRVVKTVPAAGDENSFWFCCVASTGASPTSLFVNQQQQQQTSIFAAGGSLVFSELLSISEEQETAAAAQSKATGYIFFARFSADRNIVVTSEYPIAIPGVDTVSITNLDKQACFAIALGSRTSRQVQVLFVQPSSKNLDSKIEWLQSPSIEELLLHTIQGQPDQKVLGADVTLLDKKSLVLSVASAERSDKSKPFSFGASQSASMNFKNLTLQSLPIDLGDRLKRGEADEAKATASETQQPSLNTIISMLSTMQLNMNLRFDGIEKQLLSLDRRIASVELQLSQQGAGSTPASGAEVIQDRNTTRIDSSQSLTFKAKEKIMHHSTRAPKPLARACTCGALRAKQVPNTTAPEMHFSNSHHHHHAPCQPY